MRKRLIALAIAGLSLASLGSSPFVEARAYAPPACLPYQRQTGERKDRKTPNRKSGVAHAKREAKKRRNRR